MTSYLQTFLRQGHLQKRLLANSQKSFSSLSYIGQVDSRQGQTDEEQEFDVQIGAKSINFRFDQKEEIEQLRSKLLESHEDVQKVHFKTMDGALIPGSERFQDLDSFPFRVIINDKFQYVLNLMHDISLNTDNDQNPNSQESLKAFARGIGLPQYESGLTSSFNSKLFKLVSQRVENNNMDIPKDQIIRDVFYTISFLTSTEGQNTEIQMKKSSQIKDEIVKLQKELNPMKELKERLDKKALRRANTMLFFGGSVMVSQFTFIAWGSFIEYSWDIMEPFSYMILLGNFTASFYYYTFKHKDLELGNLSANFSESIAKRLYKKNGLDIEVYREKEAEIRELQKLMNTMI